MLKYGHVMRGDFGMNVTEIDETKQQLFNGEMFSGVVVKSLLRNGPATDLGKDKGDLITQLDDMSAQSVAEFSEFVARSHPDQKVVVRYMRTGQ